MNFLDDEQRSLIFNIVNVILLLVCLSLLVFKIFIKEDKTCILEDNISKIEDNLTSEPPNNENTEEIALNADLKYKVDIKGAVNNPGVYEVEKNAIINDVINLAGGIKSNGSTKYLNLSKQVINEMVINIYTKYEISLMDNPPKNECTSNSEVITDCKNSSIVIPPSNSSSTSKKEENEKNEETSNPEAPKKVSINNGTKEELMTLSGVGESKADAIIEYRNKNGGFKTLEDLKNVSGIGDAAFEKIKDSIEL